MISLKGMNFTKRRAGKLHSAPVFGVEIEIEIESERQRWSRRAKNRAFDESITLSKF